MGGYGRIGVYRVMVDVCICVLTLMFLHFSLLCADGVYYSTASWSCGLAGLQVGGGGVGHVRGNALFLPQKV